MKRNYGNVWAIALLCGVSFAGYVQADSGATRHLVPTAVAANGAVGATANTGAKTHVKRLEQERRAAEAAADAYMAHMHSIAVGTGGGLLPGRPFPLGMENYIGVVVDADVDANQNSRAAR